MCSIQMAKIDSSSCSGCEKIQVSSLKVFIFDEDSSMFGGPPILGRPPCGFLKEGRKGFRLSWPSNTPHEVGGAFKHVVRAYVIHGHGVCMHMHIVVSQNQGTPIQTPK